jgi:hypothetical protein
LITAGVSNVRHSSYEIAVSPEHARQTQKVMRVVTTLPRNNLKPVLQQTPDRLVVRKEKTE